MWCGLSDYIDLNWSSLQSNTWWEVLMNLGKPITETSMKKQCVFVYTAWELWKQRHAMAFVMREGPKGVA